MKSTTLKTTFLVIGAVFAMAFCSKSDSPAPAAPNNPNTPANPGVPATNTIKLTDIQGRYFIIQKNVGRPLGIICFVKDNGLKFYYDASSSRRIGTPVLTKGDSTSGSATLTIDLNNNGADVFEMSLSKVAGGGLALTQTKYHNTLNTITEAGIYNAADLAILQYNNLNLALNYTADTPLASYTDSYNFAATNCVHLKIKQGNIPVTLWDKGYYTLPGGIGFKADDPGVMGAAFKKPSGRYFMLVDNGGVVREIEII